MIVSVTSRYAKTIRLVSRENFAQYGPSIQKIFNFFCSTDGQTHKRISPPPYKGTGEMFFLPFHSLHSLALLRSTKSRQVHTKCMFYY